MNVLFFKYLFDNYDYELKYSFAIQDAILSNKTIHYFIKQGDYNFQTIRDFHTAIKWYEKALAIQQQSLPSTHPDLAASYIGIGLVYSSMGDYPKALSFYEKTLVIRQQSLLPTHPDLAMSYNNMGTTHECMGNYSKAHSCLERAVDIGQRSLPANHPDLKKWRNNLARIKKKL